MFKYIEKIRTKDDRIKKQIAFVIAFTFSSILFVLWLTVFLPQFEQSQEAESRAQAADEAKSPVNNFIDALSAGVGQIKENFDDAKNVIGEMATSSIYYAADSGETNSISTQKNNI